MPSSITRLGCLFFEWAPIRHLDPTALKVWLVIYTQSDIPGLWKCDLPDIASKAFLSAEVTLRALDELRAKGLIEFDRVQRVLRLTQFPDAAEWPASPNIIRSWWSIFQKKIPACDVRDSHVATMRWLLEEGARHVPRSKTRRPSEAHEEAWQETFATVKIPVPRARGKRRFSDSDTSTPEQPSLFGDPIPDPIQSLPPKDVRGPEATPVDVSETARLGSHRDPILRDQNLRSDPDTDPVMGSGSGSGDPEWGLAQGTDPGTRTCGTVSTPPAQPALRLVPLPVDERDRRRAEIVRIIGPKHAMAFQRVKKAIGSTAFGPSIVDDFAELRQLLSEIPLDDAMERCEHALAVREAEALHSNPPSMQYFGSGMWRRRNFENALTREIADVDGSRSAPGARGSAFEVADDAISKFLAAKETT